MGKNDSSVGPAFRFGTSLEKPVEKTKLNQHQAPQNDYEQKGAALDRQRVER